MTQSQMNKMALGGALVALILGGVALLFMSEEGPSPSEEDVVSPVKGPRAASGEKRPRVEQRKLPKNMPAPTVQREVQAPRAVAPPRAPGSGEVSNKPEKEPLPPADRTGIDQRFKEIISPIRECYQAALSEFPDLEGGFKIHFVVEDVDGIGEVTEIEIRDIDSDKVWALGEPGEEVPQLEDAPMEECVMDYVGTMTFQPPAGEPLVVDYPFLFSPG